MILRKLSPICLAVWPYAALAQQAGIPQVQAEILPGWRTAQGTQQAALRLTLPPGWHTYWRSPGEAGIPPRFDWSRSDNVAAVTLAWPAPVVFQLSGITTVGYANGLVLPIEVAPVDAAGAMRIDVTLEIGVCKDLCVPVSLSVSSDLPARSDRDETIEAALRAGPMDRSAAGVTASRCTVAPLKDGLRVTSMLTMPPQGGQEFAVIETPDPDIWVQTQSSERTGDALTTVVDMVPPEAKPFDLDRSGVVITVFGGPQAVEVRGCTG